MKSSRSKELASIFRQNLGFPEIKSKSGSLLLFEEDTFTALFRERFSVWEEIEAFNEAFKVATGGVGNEIVKVNSVISSALLPLLFFYRLFYSVKKRVDLNVTLNNRTYVFDRAFFEVRNKVIGKPSCIDVVLQSKDGKTMLFLESKLTEFIDDCTINPKKYGASYIALYKSKTISEMLERAGIEVGEENGELKLTPSSPCYIEGIKQSISHLIGLVKGPQDVDDENYSFAYCEKYKDAFEQAEQLIYATILFDPTKLMAKAGEMVSEYDLYTTLYKETIGNSSFNGEMLNAIQEWSKTKNERIRIVSSPLTYQDLISANKDYPLSAPIKSFYGL